MGSVKAEVSKMVKVEFFDIFGFIGFVVLLITGLSIKNETARRELEEETGHKAIKIKKFNYSGRYKYHKLLPDRPGMIGQTFTLHSSRVRKGKVKLDKREHSDYVWVDFDTAMKMLKWPNQKKSLKMVNNWLI